MEIVLKEALQFLASQSDGITLNQLGEYLSKQPNLPSFSLDRLHHILKERNYLDENRKNKKDPISYIKMPIKMKQTYNKSYRIRYHLEDEETAHILQKVLHYILVAGPNGTSYLKLQSDLKKDGVSLQINQISHYCRKLFKFGFISIQVKQHFKNAIASKYLKKTQLNQLQIENKIEEEESSKEDREEFNSKRTLTDFQRKECFYFREFSFFQNLCLILASQECQDKDGLTLFEIQKRLNKIQEKKSLSRLFETLHKEGEIVQQAERQGKIFSYRYKLSEPRQHAIQLQTQSLMIIKQAEQVQKAKKSSFSRVEQKLPALETPGTGLLVIKIIDDALMDIVNCIKAYDPDFNLNEKAVQQQKMDSVLIYLHKLSQAGQNQGSKTLSNNQRRKTQPSRQKFNRFSAIINLLYTLRITKQIDIRKEIVSLDNGVSGTVDGRTIQNIMSVLLELKFCTQEKVSVVIANKTCERTLYIHHSVPMDDPLVKQGLENLKNINKSQFLKKERKASYEMSEESEPRQQKKIKQEQPSRISKNLQSIVKQFIQEKFTNEKDKELKEELFHSDEEQPEIKKSEKGDHLIMDKEKYKGIAFFLALSKVVQANNQGTLKVAFYRLYPFYHIEVVNEVFQYNPEQQYNYLKLCNSLENKIRTQRYKQNGSNHLAQEINNNYEYKSWEQINEELDLKIITWEEETKLYFKLTNEGFFDIKDEQQITDLKQELTLYQKKPILFSNYDRMKKSLLKHPYLSVQHFLQRFNQVDVKIFLAKCFLDKTVNVVTEENGQTVFLKENQISGILDSKQNLDKIYIRITPGYLEYFMQ